MPKTINWETTEISFYKFVCKNPDILFSYVGHTVSFRQRKSGHKGNCNNPNRKNYNVPLYKYMREHGGFENWDMIVIHTQICKDKRDAERIETELMEQQQYKLNVMKAFVSEEQIAIRVSEYREQHKQQIAVKTAEYYNQHKEQIAIQKAEYYNQHKEQLVSYAAEYYNQHKEQIAIKAAAYRGNNRDILNAKKRAKRALLKAQLNCEILDATNP